jgi:exonuclease SbcC
VIPKQLQLKNFLSYREATLDFDGIHVACIAGPNGAGKSSLLEAMAWAIWGQSRVATDEDVIHQGQLETQVTFVFAQGDQIYRIIRSRHRLQGSRLEFQVRAEAGYRVLTQRGVRATQQLICHHLKLDYDTFINSAYLRQGRLDDFMLKRPSERKQILTDLLKLDQYDRLADQAREQLRQVKAEVALRQTQLHDMTSTLTQHQAGLTQQEALQDQLRTLDQQRETLQQQLQQLRRHYQECQHDQQQLQLKRQQYHHVAQLQQQSQATLTELKTHLDSMQQVLLRQQDIEAGLTQFYALEKEDADLEQTFTRHQHLRTLANQLTRDVDAKQAPLQSQLRQLHARQQALASQHQDLLPILQKAEEITTARQQFVSARRRLHHLDALQLQAEPLQRRRQQIQVELGQEHTRLHTRLEELNNTLARLHQQRHQGTQLETTVQEVTQTLDYLEQRRTYQEQVREKGQERRQFMETLQANQRTYEAQLARVEQKLQLLHDPEAVCPLCDRALDTHHRTLVEDRHRLEQQQLREDIIIIREQLAVTEREVQVLRQEYRALEAELELYAPVLQQRGHLEAQLSTHTTLEGHIRQIEHERQQLQYCLETEAYATALRAELKQLEQSLAQLAYDDRDHALARGQVDRLRWAEIKHHELQQAQTREHRIKMQQQQVTQNIAALEDQLEQLSQTPLHQQLQETLSALDHLNYDADHHHRIRQALRQAQTWPLQQQALEQAQHNYPQCKAQVETLIAQQQQQQQELSALTESIRDLDHQLQGIEDASTRMQQLETDIDTLQCQREVVMAQLGAFQQQQRQLEELQQQLQQKQQELAQATQQQRVYQELVQAFGTNGIQAMMIENLLPQLEAETNHLLGRLSAHQLHVRFVTQRASKRQQGKLIDTLDILIADANGTRPYETYSGGEAFRVNFAIRLALARLLALRSGLALRLLIIDEGFGTQDQQGCERLVGAINAIADDFACILAVTHIPHFREAFQTRIDVVKEAEGSQIFVSA